MAINKVIFGNTTLMDTTGVTVTPDKMVLGTTALSASGDTITGTLGPATQSTDGLMSATDKAKLDDANACAMVGPSAMVSFSDAIAADALNLSVDIEPTQDLHGYDHPWPAGGGKNVLPYRDDMANATVDGITYTINKDADGNVISITANGTATQNTIFHISNRVTFPAGSYILSGCPFGGSNPGYMLFDRVEYFSGYEIGSGISATQASEHEIWIAIRITSGITVNNVVFKPMIRLASVSDATFAPYSNICPISGWTEANVTVSPSQNAQDGTTYDITFPDEAGTVYGGTLDVTTGLLTVDRAMVDLGTLNYSYNADYQMFVAQVSGMSTSPSKGGLCSILKPTNMWVTSDEWAHGDCLLSLGGADYYIRCKWTNYTSAADFKAALSGQKLVYELATPKTYQLTTTQIALLDGVNNVWADCGNVTLGYLRADSLCINRAIAARLDGLDMLGFYIDNDGYICQRIGSDT